MSKSRGFKGLKFKYRADGVNRILMDKYLTIDEFLNTEFPKNNNSLSPRVETEIFDITWNNKRATINKDVKTVSDLRKILSGECYVSNSDIRLGKFDFNFPKLERKSIHSIEEIRELIEDVLFEEDKKNARIELDGDFIKGNSQRYQTFFTKGTRCVCCGIEGKFFAKEKFVNAKSYHLNLYAIDENDKEILMTKDHILPKSKGGKDHISNYQTMCVRCNMTKGNNVEK